MTARDLITGSLRIVGALANGEAPSASELQDGISALNDLLDSWSAQSLAVNARVRESFALLIGKQSYTMGAAGDFNTSRPLEIEQATIEVTSASPSVEVPLAMLNDQEWADELVKGVSSAIPTKLHMQGTSPLETLDLWPIPAAVFNIILYSRKPLAQVANGNTAFTLPPGYNRALRYNLAAEIAGEYGRTISPKDQSIADDAFAIIKRQNTKPAYLKTETAALGSQGKRFNILTGDE